MSHRLIFLGATLLLLFAGRAALATTLQRMSLEELAAASPAIARVRILSSESRVEGGRIWTLTSADVVETMKGSVPRRITLRLLGGRTRGLISKVEGVPQFAPSEDVYLFLQPLPTGEFAVVSWVQGTFRVERDREEERVSQDTAGVAVFDPATRRFEKGEVRRLPLAEFRARVQRAVARAAGGSR